jgi:hypothetical protein
VLVLDLREDGIDDAAVEVERGAGVLHLVVEIVRVDEQRLVDRMGEERTHEQRPIEVELEKRAEPVTSRAGEAHEVRQVGMLAGGPGERDGRRDRAQLDRARHLV